MPNIASPTDDHCTRPSGTWASTAAVHLISLCSRSRSAVTRKAASTDPLLDWAKGSLLKAIQLVKICLFAMRHGNHQNCSWPAVRVLCEDFPQPGVVSSYPIVFFTGLHVKDSDMEEERRGGGSGGVKAALKFLPQKVCILFVVVELMSAIKSGDNIFKTRCNKRDVGRVQRLWGGLMPEAHKLLLSPALQLGH